jgi:excinuclease ABC subunit C
MSANDPIQEKLSQLPRKPGVYLFKDNKGKTLYIGKAKVLTNRVRSYFHKSTNHSLKVNSLLRKVKDLEWIVTGSEVEALLTEANLIKEQMPHYNVLLRDDKSFPYIRITSEPFPQVFITRKVIHDSSKYFGPFTDVIDLRRTLKVLHKIFPIRSCDYNLNNTTISVGRYSVCLDYHIKKCQGPCEGLVTEKAYEEMIQNVIRFLHGQTSGIRKSLKERMESAANNTRYEEAATCRDQLQSVEKFAKRQNKATASFDDKDVIAIANDSNDACGVVVRIRGGRIVGREKVFLTGVLDETMERMVSDFIRQFYLITHFVPGEIVVPAKPKDEKTLTNWLESKREKRLKFIVPQRGEKARLLRITRQNADLLLGEQLRKRERRKELIPAMVNRLQEDLNLAVPPRRIEAFDISNIQGKQPVGSMVCFVDGKPKKSDYRKFKIKTVEGVDDFAMMREVVHRRYSRLKSEHASFPDLVLIDGGKGQLSMAMSALQELGLSYIPVAALAKRLEEVFLPRHPDPQSVSKTSPGLILLRRIRDEAHRFAVSFHRQRRAKLITKSLFDDVKGVGPVTRKKLYDKFQNLESIAQASSSEIKEKIGVALPLATKIMKAARRETANEL